MTKIVFGDDAVLCGDGVDSFICGHTPPVPRQEHKGVLAESRCRSGCKTQNHESWGECLRAAEVGVYHVAVSKGFDGTTQKKWDRELASYKRAREEGIAPDGTKQKKIDEARRLSDAAGAAYGRDFSKATPMGE